MPRTSGTRALPISERSKYTWNAIRSHVSPAHIFLSSPLISPIFYTRRPANSPQAPVQFFFFTLFQVMKLHALTTLLFFSAATLSTTGSRAQPQHQRHGHRDLVARAAKGELDFAAAKRQNPVVAAAPAPSASASSQTPSSASAASPITNSAASSAGATATSSLSGSASVSGTGVTGSNSSQPTPVVPVPAGANGVPALSLLSSGMPSGTPSPVVSTYAPGATPSFPGGPALPAQCKFLPLVSSLLLLARRLAADGWTVVVFSSADWPAQDKVPDTCEPRIFGGPFLGLGMLNGWRSF